MPPALAAQNRDHWTTREVSKAGNLKKKKKKKYNLFFPHHAFPVPMSSSDLLTLSLMVAPIPIPGLYDRHESPIYKVQKHCSIHKVWFEALQIFLFRDHINDHRPE